MLIKAVLHIYGGDNLVIDFSKINYKEKPILILKNLDGTAIQTLGYAFNVMGEFSYNEISTLTFCDL